MSSSIRAILPFCPRSPRKIEWGRKFCTERFHRGRCRPVKRQKGLGHYDWYWVIYRYHPPI